VATGTISAWRRSRGTILVLGVLVFLPVAARASIAAPAGEPLAVFEARERVGRDWPRTLVTYPIALRPGQAWPGRVRLLDEDGQAHPVQLWRVTRHADGSVASARVSFFAALPRGGRYRFRLVPGRPPRVIGAPTARIAGGFLTLANRVTAIRLRYPGARVFTPPLRPVAEHATARERAGRMEGAGLAFGPIAGIRLAGWVGESHFAAPAAGRAPRVTGYESRVLERGPLFVEAETIFRFDAGGRYRLSARVLVDDPAVRLDEVVDLGETSPPAAPLELVISLASTRRAPRGWSPDAAFLFAPRRLERDPGLEAALRGHGIEPRDASVVVRGETRGVVVTELASHEPWGAWAHYAGLVRTAELAASPRAPFLAIVPMHAGTWRGAHAVARPRPRIVAYGPGDVALRWPLQPEPHPQHVLHTGEPDPEFSRTGLRRLWALVAGPFQYHDGLAALRGSEGFVTLDDYKDWILEWSDDTRLARDAPLRDADLREPGPLWHLAQAWTVAADRDRMWVSHYRQAEPTEWTGRVRARLADPALPAVERGRLRSALAALCHLLTEPDFNTRGSMGHQGNPNMPLNRFFALPFAAALIPDHPLYARWMDLAAEYVRYELARNVAPGGAWSELVTYFPAGGPTLIHGALVAESTGRLDPATRAQVVGLAGFTLRLLTPPDPRFGVRLLPGFGHEGNVVFNHWLPAAALARPRDPETAALFAWAWQEQGRPFGGQHDNGFSALTRAEAELATRAAADAARRALPSAWLPGFGAVLRAHPGTPGETYLAYRQGYHISHSDANQGDFVLYGRGAPLVAGSLLPYPFHQDDSYQRLYRDWGWHSRVRIGRRGDDGGWPGGGALSGVHAHFFDGRLDYLRGVGDWPAPAGAGGLRRWTRQILFPKAGRPEGPSYFLLRDAIRTPSGEPVRPPETWWWDLRTPGRADRVASAPAGFTYRSPWRAILDVRLLVPADVPIASRDATREGVLYGDIARAWAAAGSPVLRRDANSVLIEDAITVTAVGPLPSSRDLLAILYPRRVDEPPPDAELVGDGVARVRTPEGTDYLFLSAEPRRVRMGEIAFEGVAGAIRVTGDGVDLVVAEGPGTVAYRGVTLHAAVPSARHFGTAEVERGGTVEVPAPATIDFALDPGAGPVMTLAPGIQRQRQADRAVAYRFDAPEPITFAEEQVVFVGRRGGLVVDRAGGTVRAVLLDGERLGYGGLVADVARGPYEVTFRRDRVVGRSDGPARLLHVTLPPGLDQMPTLVVEGVPYAPGLHGRVAVVPLGGGPFRFTLETLRQPPVFRSWRWW
jgi:hypothetical protein